MDRNELNTEIEMASRLCEGQDSKVVLLCGGVHYEIKNVIPLGVAIVIEAGVESEAPVDPLLEEEGNDPAHLQIAEDQPSQDPDPRDTKGDLEYHEMREEGRW